MTQSNSKRERLTTAARQLIHAKGYTQTTLAEIADIAKVPLGNVYYYFKTKDELVSAVITSLLEDFNQLTHELDRLADSRARIDGFLSMLVLESEQVAQHGCPVGSLCTELNKGTGQPGQQANGLLQAQLDWLTRQFEQMAKGEEASDLALHLMAQLQGAAVLSHAFDEPAIYTRQIVAAKAWLNTL